MTGVATRRAIKDNQWVRMTTRYGKGVLVALAVAALFAACTDELGNKLSGFDVDEASEEARDILTGRARLSGETDHNDIRVELPDAGFSMFTDKSGNFQLPRDLSDGEWTIVANYPFFHSVTRRFNVVRGVPESPLATIELPRAIAFGISTNGTFFGYGSTVVITLAATNVSTNPVIIASTRRPIAAFAVRRNGETVAGGLFPGYDALDPVEIEFAPGDTQYFQMRWKIDNPDITSGYYDIYAALASDVTHPSYFSEDAEDAAFNESLFAKLSPVTIRVN
ncbi:hypothetical protein K8I61_13715 [bacterium]|nr:hypothetical protein [bacterium]